MKKKAGIPLTPQQCAGMITAAIGYVAGTFFYELAMKESKERCILVKDADYRIADEIWREYNEGP